MTLHNNVTCLLVCLLFSTAAFRFSKLRNIGLLEDYLAFLNELSPFSFVYTFLLSYLTGPIGLSCMLAAKSMGASQVCVTGERCSVF